MAKVRTFYLLFLLFLSKYIAFSSSKSKLITSKELDELAVDNFREYLRIPSVHPDVDYSKLLFFIEFYLLIFKVVPASSLLKN